MAKPMLIKTFRNDGTENWINPKYVAYVTTPEGSRYEGTIIFSCGTSVGYARPANLAELINKAIKETQE